MEPKKISFGFKKTIAKPGKVVEEKKEFIECVEEKSIRVVGGEELQVNLPIVIPAQPNTLRNAERIKQIAESVEKGIQDPVEESVQQIKSEPIIPENETLDQMAVRELMEEAKNVVKTEISELKLVAPENRIPDGAKESTLEDYENIPVGEFGMAMLRGMGWDAKQEKSKYKLPELRPKGLGLGADKVVKDNQKKSAKKENEELTVVKNGFVKVVTGKYSNYYGQIVSLDEDNGRVMVNIPMKKETVSLSEFMVQPVTKSEYDKESKVINKGSYDAYKKTESEPNKRNTDSPKNNDRSHHNSPKESSSYRNSESHKEKGDKYSERNDNDRNRTETRNDRDSYRINKDSDDRRRDKERRRRDSSSEKQIRRRDSSYSSDLSSPERNKKSKHKKKRDKSTETDSSDSERKYKSKKSNGKRDIDKKRKGKKKKRDRDRSPNHRKHRK